MALDLPPPLAAYFDATNAHDADTLAALFADDGVVRDEGGEMPGRAAIRDWATDTFRKYDTAATPGDWRADGDKIVVRTRIAGTFPGSPIHLDFRFGLAGERIVRLEIG